MKFIFLVSISALFYSYIYTSGACGQSNPTSSADCVPYSNSTNLCCFLNATNNPPASFSVCTNMKSMDVYSYITVGSMQYTVDCKGVTGYNDLFPFELDYSPCGINNPGVASDCDKYSKSSKSCCITSLTGDFTDNTLCYYYPRHIGNVAKNYSDVNRLGKPLYFWCDASYLNMKMSLIYLLIFLIFSGVF